MPGQPGAHPRLQRAVADLRRHRPGFPGGVRASVLDIEYDGETTPVPVHTYRRLDGSSDVPVVLMLGGVDTWKMDIHQSILEASITRT
jgi:esterase FrsA